MYINFHNHAILDIEDIHCILAKDVIDDKTKEVIDITVDLHYANRKNVIVSFADEAERTKAMLKTAEELSNPNNFNSSNETWIILGDKCLIDRDVVTGAIIQHDTLEMTARLKFPYGIIKVKESDPTVLNSYIEEISEKINDLC